MRVVLANKFLYPRGGAERAVLTLGGELEKRGHEVFYFGMDHPHNTVSGDHVQLVRWRDYSGQNRGRRLLDAVSMLYSFEARRRFGNLLDRARPHVVHAHNIYHQLSPSILDAARVRRVPVVMTLHDYKLVCPRYDLLRHGKPCDACVEEGPTACLRHRCAGGSWGQSLLLATESALHGARGSYDGVRLFLAPSRFLVGVLLRAGFDNERLRHVPNFAFRSNAVDDTRTKPHRFVYVGRLGAEKGLLTLARAVGGLARGEWVVCGSGPLGDELQRLAAQAPAGRIQLRGHLETTSLEEELVQAGFVVLPSECFENAPFAVLEAMAAGRAVLASRLGGLPELVDDGHTGELIEPGVVEAWTGALERALDDPERMRRMGEAGRRTATTRFGLQEHVAAVENVYHEVCA